MSSVEFLRPHLIGRRFQGAAIPLEILSDLAVLGEMVIEVAKWCYLERHPNRERSPKGFATRVALKLVGVEEGSAILVINLEFLEAQGTGAPRLPDMPAEYQDDFFEARDVILDTIDRAGQDAGEYRLPQKHLAFFDRFGRGLQDGEAIELQDPSGQKSARLDRESRRKLVQASRIMEMTEEVVIRGSIPEADQDRMTFELQTYQGKIPGRIPDQHFDTMLEAFNQYQASGKVAIQGVVKYDRGGRPIAIEAVEDVVFLDPLDVPLQLDSLRSMKDGWLDGDGLAPAAQLVEWLAESFDYYPDDTELPYLYPTAEGGVQAEWTLGSHEISITFHPQDRIGEWHDLALDSDEEKTQELDFSDGGGWEWVARRVAALSQPA